MKLILPALMAFIAQPAFADSLFNDDICPSTGSTSAFSMQYDQPELNNYFEARTSIGLSCQDIHTIERATSYVKLALIPAGFALRHNPTLAADLAAAGLAMSNPAVLTVSVIGVVGATTLYIVLKASIEECARMEQAELRESIVRELEAKYGLQPNQSGLPLEIQQ